MGTVANGCKNRDTIPMFNSITGTITAKLPTILNVENSGVEWEFSVSTLSLDSFGLIGDTTRVFTWLYHREDQMRLYGFPSDTDRQVFLELIKVDGIGPRQAIKILSSITAKDLRLALEGEDVTRLSSAPGIGKKTAQKMILTLKGKLVRDQSFSSDDAVGEHADIVTALTDMGFDRKAAGTQVSKIAAELVAADPAPLNGGDLEKEIFRRAIVALSSSARG